MVHGQIDPVRFIKDGPLNYQEYVTSTTSDVDLVNYWRTHRRET